MTVDLHDPSSGLGQIFVKYARKIYNPLGFKKGYNFPLFIITCGAFMGFFFARVRYFNIDGYFMKNAIPGEQYYYNRNTFQRVAIIIHIVTVLPAIFLVCFQFVPIIRYKAILFHRINGYVVIVLLLAAIASAFMLMRHAVGGEVQTQLFIGVLGTITTIGTFLAWYNIKRLQIDQHRAWMLRVWAWAGAIISQRLIMLAAGKIITRWYVYYVAFNCAELSYIYTYFGGMPDQYNPARKIYPACVDPSAHVVVRTSPETGPESLAAQLRITFGISGWTALIIHAILVELYLALTPAESARLRLVSYERQLKAGHRHPEKGALTATRLGDAPPGWNSPLNTSTLQRGEVKRFDSSSGEEEETKAGPQSTGTHAV